MQKALACNSECLVRTLCSGLRSVGEMERGGENRGFVDKEDMREGGRRGLQFGPDASVSAVTFVAIELQQGLPCQFNHWLFTVAMRHVI